MRIEMMMRKTCLIFVFLVPNACVKKTEVARVDPSIFYGSWTSACKQESGNVSTNYVNTISAETWIFVRDQFASPDCSGPSVLKMRVDSSLTFQSEGVVPHSKNYKQVVGKTYVTPLTEASVADLKSTTAKDNWSMGAEAEFNMGFADENSVVYNVMKIVDGKLCLGKEDESKDKTTEDKRPSEIDVSDCLQKKE